MFSGTADNTCDFCGYVRTVIAPGDLNGDGSVTAEDAVYLLYHTLFGAERYPVAGSCDFDKDGAVTAGDAVYLLYHTLFGAERYPL